MAVIENEFEEWLLKRLMTEVAGTGTKSAEDMTREQVSEAMRHILTGEPDHTTLGALWLADRWRHSNAEELTAYADVMAEHVEYAEPDAGSVNCGANCDDKGTTAVLGVVAGVVAVVAGTPVVVHSGDRVPTQKQDAYKHILDELDVRMELDLEGSADMVDGTGFGFYYQPRLNPAIHTLWERRDSMGVRTFVNITETIVNPADASVHLGSFYRLAFARKMVNTFEASEHHDLDRVLMFQGMEGCDDIRPGYAKVAEWTIGDDGETTFDNFDIEAAEYDMDFEYDDLGADEDDVAGDSVEITETALADECEDRFADAVALNAALRIYIREDAETVDEGLEVARETIASGDVEAVLEDLRDF